LLELVDGWYWPSIEVWMAAGPPYAQQSYFFEKGKLLFDNMQSYQVSSGSADCDKF